MEPRQWIARRWHERTKPRDALHRRHDSAARDPPRRLLHAIRDAAISQDAEAGERKRRTKSVPAKSLSAQVILRGNREAGVQVEAMTRGIFVRRIRACVRVTDREPMASSVLRHTFPPNFSPQPTSRPRSHHPDARPDRGLLAPPCQHFLRGPSRPRGARRVSFVLERSAPLGRAGAARGEAGRGERRRRDAQGACACRAGSEQRVLLCVHPGARPRVVRQLSGFTVLFVVESRRDFGRKASRPHRESRRTASKHDGRSRVAR